MALFVKLLNKIGLMTVNQVKEDYISYKTHKLLTETLDKQLTVVTKEKLNYKRDLELCIKSHKELEKYSSSLKKENKHLSKNVDRLLRKQKEYKEKEKRHKII